ncbi:hypothetical protein [Streptomyces virginiae]|uniref:hypothetical protein n=1 Tax=Streptomyces virginiae TaxID=1961 RepID=UPI00068E8C94|nr:hypothetical protein [Streptomyces virginiae]
MAHDLHTPTTGRHLSRLGICITAVVFAAGAFTLPASAAMGSPSQPPVKSGSAEDPNGRPDGQCKSGYVYRDERDAAHAKNPTRQPGTNQCQSGYVYRDSYEGDGVCVTPEERDKWHEFNPNRQPGTNQCKSGYVWRDAWDGDDTCVTPKERDKWHVRF